MTAFLSTHTLALTPLSPIHIGCGEDFEPTNYVIEDGLLYGFDPSRATLTDEQRNKLMNAVMNKKAALPAIQRFFRDNAAAFKPHAHVVMPVAKGVAQMYEQRIGKTANVEASGNQVFNKLEIERHVFTGPLQQPFIPGTSFKGALRTAWLDELNGGRTPRDAEYKHNGEAKSTTHMETTLLGGDFQTSPLRLLKVADLMPVREPEREVLFAVNRKKRMPKDGEAPPKGITARKDCVLPGQYRLFQAGVTLPALLAHTGATDAKGKPLTPQRNQLDANGSVNLKRLAQQSNAYHQQRLRRELGVLDGRGLVNPDWKRSVEALLAPGGELDKKLAAGQAFLIRLGRYGGADNKTLTGEGVASIKIMGARVNGKQEFSFEPTTKTVWLAAQHDTDQKHLTPFGWAVVEIDPQADCASLKNWCATQAQGRPNMAAKRAALQVERQAAIAQKAQQAVEAAKRAAAVEAERLAAEQRAQALLQMSPQAQLVEAMRQACEDLANKLPPNGNFKKLAPDDKKPGLYKDVAALVKVALESPDWSAADKATLADMLETWLPKVIAPWDAKEQRKKLKFAALRTNP